MLVRNLRLRNKHKLADRWEPTIYVVTKQRADLPVYSVKPEKEEGPLRTLHRDLLLPCGFLPETEREELEMKSSPKRPRTRQQSAIQQGEESFVSDTDACESWCENPISLNVKDKRFVKVYDMPRHSPAPALCNHSQNLAELRPSDDLQSEGAICSDSFGKGPEKGTENLTEEEIENLPEEETENLPEEETENLPEEEAENLPEEEAENLPEEETENLPEEEAENLPEEATENLPEKETVINSNSNKKESENLPATGTHNVPEMENQNLPRVEVPNLPGDLPVASSEPVDGNPMGPEAADHAEADIHVRRSLRKREPSRKFHYPKLGNPLVSVVTSLFQGLSTALADSLNDSVSGDWITNIPLEVTKSVITQQPLTHATGRAYIQGGSV